MGLQRIVASAIGKRRSAAKEDSTEVYQKRRKEIGLAAVRVFNKLGFTGASISAVAAELDIDRASLYYYISSKEELFDEILREVIERNASISRRILADKVSPRRKLRELIIALMSSYGENYPLIYIYIRENLAHVSDKRSAWSKYMRKLNREIESAVIAIIEEGYADQSFRNLGSSKVVAYGMLGILGWTHRWFKPETSDVSTRRNGQGICRDDPFRPRVAVLKHLEQARGAHAAADAHRHHNVAHAAPLALDQGVPDHACAGHAVRMADRDRTAVDVEALVGDAEPVAAIEHLHRERLVQFPQTDVVDREAEALQQLRHCKHRSDAHLVGLGARDRHADIAAQRLQDRALRPAGFHHDAGRRAIGELAGVARGDRAVRRTGFSAGEAVERRFGAVAFVLRERDVCDRVASPVALSVTFMSAVTGTISASKRPAACAAAVRCCDCRA